MQGIWRPPRACAAALAKSRDTGDMLSLTPVADGRLDVQ
jgi:hypothetical protein